MCVCARVCDDSFLSFGNFKEVYFSLHFILSLLKYNIT